MTLLMRSALPVARRHLPSLVMVLVYAALFSAGVHAQGYTPIDMGANRLLDLVIRIAPPLAGVAFFGAGVYLAVGHHDAYGRLGNVCFGAAVAMGALTMVQYFRA